MKCRDCTRKAIQRGFCRPCWRVARERGEFVPKTPAGEFRPCSVDGCVDRHEAKGLCSKHYQRLRDHGDTQRGRVTPVEALEKRLWLLDLVQSTPTGKCVDWPWSCGSTGYGQIRIGNELWRTHVLVLHLLTGLRPIQHVRQALHSCDRRVCCAPWHLRWGSQSDNMYDRYRHLHTAAVIQ